jgi:hypothetical protein
VESLCKGYPDEADFVSLSEVEVLEWWQLMHSAIDDDLFKLLLKS